MTPIKRSKQESRILRACIFPVEKSGGGGVKGQAGVQWTISKPIKKKANPELIFQ